MQLQYNAFSATVLIQIGSEINQIHGHIDATYDTGPAVRRVWPGRIQVRGQAGET